MTAEAVCPALLPSGHDALLDRHRGRVPRAARPGPRPRRAARVRLGRRRSDSGCDGGRRVGGRAACGRRSTASAWSTPTRSTRWPTPQRHSVTVSTGRRRGPVRRAVRHGGVRWPTPPPSLAHWVTRPWRGAVSRVPRREGPRPTIAGRRRPPRSRRVDVSALRAAARITRPCRRSGPCHDHRPRDPGASAPRRLDRRRRHRGRRGGRRARRRARDASSTPSLLPHARC